MKVILSRKGFDSSYGGKPSFIYENKLISVPIPEVDSGVKYEDIQFLNTDDNLLKVMKDLSIFQYTEAHVDPDINPFFSKRKTTPFIPLFGQAGGAASRLMPADQENSNTASVQPGDIFLFYGWFRELVKLNKKYKYNSESKDYHCIYGYMVVDDVISNQNITDNREALLEKYGKHSHFIKTLTDYYGKNVVFIGKNSAEQLGKPGFGCFNYSNELVLTKMGDNTKRSLWEVPDCFYEFRKNGGINANDFGGTGNFTEPDDNGMIEIKFNGRNHQELIISEYPDYVKWAINLIKNNEVYTG